MRKKFLSIFLFLLFSFVSNSSNIIIDGFESRSIWLPFGGLEQFRYSDDSHGGQSALLVSGYDFDGGLAGSINLKKGQYLYAGWLKAKLEPGSKLTLFATDLPDYMDSKVMTSSIDEWTYFQSIINVEADGIVELIPVHLQGSGEVIIDDIILSSIEDGYDEKYLLQSVVQMEPAMIPLLAQKPVVDGKDNSDDYYGAYSTNVSFPTGKEPYLSEPMEIKMGRYENNLYIFVKSYEPNPQNILSVGERRDGELWKGDFIAVFLAPDYSRYYQLIANPEGYQFDEEIVNGIKNAGWDGNWQVKTSKGSDFWVTEFEIPLADFGYDKLEPGQTMYLNICRQRVNGSQYYSWSNVGDNFHQPEKFRPILFMEKSMPEEVELTNLGFQTAIQFSNVSTPLFLSINNKRNTDCIIALEAASLSGSRQIDTVRKIIVMKPGETANLELPIIIGEPGYMPLSIKLKLKDLEADEYFRLIDLNVKVAPAPGLFGKSLVTTDDAAFWLTDGNYKVQRHDLPPQEKTSEIQIYAAKNETESFQIVVRPENDLTDVNFTVETFVNEYNEKIDLQWQVKNVEYVKVIEPSDERGYGGLWTDPLVPQEIYSFRGGQNNPVWVELFIPENVPAGEYKSTLVISGPEMLEVRIPILLRVFNFSLPKEPALRTAYGFWGGWIGHLSEQEHDLYMQEFRNHRISPYNFGANIRLIEEDSGSFTLDFEDFDRLGKRYLDDFGFNSFNLSFPKVICGEQGWDNPNYLALLKTYGEMVEKHLVQMGWLDKAYLYWFDEPSEEEYPLVNQGMQVLKEAFPNIPRLLTEQPEPELVGNVEIWVPCLGGNSTPTSEKERKDAGEEVWRYVCNAPEAPYPNNFVDEPALDHRIRFWMAWEDGLSGDLYWNTIYWQTIGIDNGEWFLRPIDGDIANGDGFLFYPWQGSKEDFKPITSQRLAQIRDGIEDYDYFVILQETLEQARTAKVDHELLSEAEKLLEVPSELCQGHTMFASTPSLLLQHRIKMGEMIEKLISVME